MAGRAAFGFVLWAAVSVALSAPFAGATSAVVRNGYELHTSLTSPSVTWIVVAGNVTFSLNTCPFPASEAFPATIISRNVTIISASADALSRAAAAGAPLDPAAASLASAAAANGPFWIDCSSMDGRFQLAPGFTLEYNSVVLINCRTLSTAGGVTKRKGSTLILNNTVENQGSVCLPLPTQQGVANSLPRQPGLAPPPGRPAGQQVTSLAAPGSNWCAAAATGTGAAAASNSTPPLPPQLMPTVLVNRSGSATCQMSALVIGNAAVLETPTPINASNKEQPQPPQEPFTLLLTRSAILCPDPVSVECLRQNGTDACLAAAFAAVNPDNFPPCPAFNGFMLHNCLIDPKVTRILVLADSQMNTSTCPSWLSEDPFIIDRNVTIMSDPRGPRMLVDCSHVTDRVQIAPNVTITLFHLRLARCSIGYEKPLSIFRFDQGSRLIVNDTFIQQPDNLCLPVQQQSGILLHKTRPATIPGQQQIAFGNPQAWCSPSSGTRTVATDIGNVNGSGGVGATSSARDNSSYSTLPPLPQEFANRTGLGPAYSATLDQPAVRPFFVHATWPATNLCQQQALVLFDYAYNDRFAWTLPPNVTRTQALQSAQQPQPQSPSPNSSSSSGPDANKSLPSELVQQLGPGYTSGSLPVHYINSAWLCEQPSAACTAVPNTSGQSVCLLQGYTRINPDVVGAAGDPNAGGYNYGVQVVLPAVLVSVLGTLLLASLACCLFVVRKRYKQYKAQKSLAVAKGPYDPGHSNTTGTSGTPSSSSQPLPGFASWLLGGGHSSAASSDPARRLLGIHDFSPAATTTDGTTPSGSAENRSSGQSAASAARRLASAAPDGIQLSMMLGAGSFGRVYAGVWQGLRVAVKIISHSAEDDTRISRELSLSLGFDHPNLVRALHYARIRINPNSGEASLGAPSANSGSLFLPEGAVGVFDLPSTWAVIQRQGLGTTTPAMIDTETWIVMDLMDQGNLAAAIRRGAFLDQTGDNIRPASLLRRCADIAAGMTYLHSRNVCHGDLKCENILLRSEPQDPDGLMAAVADFGLSRALAFGQSHLSTRRYGTVTHMPPELLVAGKLTPAADIYSLGIMMWEMVSRTPPFAGLHHGEVIHKVVTQDLRPGPWPAAARLVMPPAYFDLAEECWARQSLARPSANVVLQRLLDMLAMVEEGQQQQQQQ